MEFLEFKKFLMKSTNYMFSDQFYENISESYLNQISKDVNKSELFVDILNFNGKNVSGEIYEKALEKGYTGSHKKLIMMIKEYLFNNGIKFKNKRTATERYFVIEK